MFSHVASLAIGERGTQKPGVANIADCCVHHHCRNCPEPLMMSFVPLRTTLLRDMSVARQPDSQPTNPQLRRHPPAMRRVSRTPPTYTSRAGRLRFHSHPALLENTERSQRAPADHRSIRPAARHRQCHRHRQRRRHQHQLRQYRHQTHHHRRCRYPPDRPGRPGSRQD